MRSSRRYRRYDHVRPTCARSTFESCLSPRDPRLTFYGLLNDHRVRDTATEMKLRLYRVGNRVLAQGIEELFGDRAARSEDYKTIPVGSTFTSVPLS
jgi:hypothetical protein